MSVSGPIRTVLMLALWATAAGAEVKSLEIHALERLASPALEGRLAGSPAGERAAVLVDSLFRAAGLSAPPFTAPGATPDEPASQAFTWVDSGFREGASLEFRLSSGLQPVIHDPRLYSIPAWSGGGQVQGEVLFAGYGLVHREIPRWDDYAHLDLRGKVVVLQAGLPAGVRPSPDNSLPARAALAARLGAEAVLFCPDAFGSLDLRESAGGELAFAPVSLPVAFLGPELADSLLFEAAYTTRSFVGRMNRQRKSASLLLDNQRIRIVTPDPAPVRRGRNILGWLPGLSPEVLLVTAHFDHLGLVDPGLPPAQGNVYTGADDNASGVSALLAVARRMAALPTEQRPLSMLFVAFDGEEQGRVGSRWFCSDLPVPANTIRLVLNLDMVGRLEGRPLTVFDAGRAEGLPALLEEAARAEGLELALSDLEASPGDHSSFLERGVPAIMLFSGTHPDYNTPRDTADRIDRQGLARVGRFLEGVLARVGQRGGGFARIGDTPVSAPGAARVTVAMGIVPGYAAGGQGMEVSAVKADSPAGRAGLQAGDRITGLGGFPVTSIYDYTFALRHFHAGDTVPVALLRAGRPLRVDVVLAERETP
jgi:hypothetical protein